MSNLYDVIAGRLGSLSVPVAVILPSGERAGPPRPRVCLRFSDPSDLLPFASGRSGDIASSIVEGRIAVEGSMRELMAVAAEISVTRDAHAPRPALARLLGWLQSRRSHSREQDSAQIQFHYDVSDEFYALWQDPRRVYSCAYYPEDSSSLAEAQEAKLDLICRKLDLKPGERFLDIGAGWGGLLLWAAERYGVDATGITLSQNQYAHVRRLIADKGLENRVRIELRDYRDLPTTYPWDKIASVGMFEHVGTAMMPVYFGQLTALLRPGGLLMNHGITASGLATGDIGGGLADFMDRYIFPGGELIHVSRAVAHAAQAGLEPVDMECLRPHYARTLWAWSDALEARLDDAERILARDVGDARGRKILAAYRLYLAGCAMAFEQGWISLYQILATRPNGNITTGTMRGAQSDYRFRRDYMYSRHTTRQLS